MIILLAAGLLALFGGPALADETTILDRSGEDCTPEKCAEGTAGSGCKNYCGNYEANDIFLLLKKISNIILGVVGALALLAFVAGGFMFLFSGGSQTWVARGKETIKGAVIGLIVVFLSYMMIRFTYDLLAPEYKDDPFETGFDAPPQPKDSGQK